MSAGHQMRATSQAEYLAATSRGVPKPELIAEGLWTLPMLMPSGGLRYTLSAVHLGSTGGVTIVDPGWQVEGGLSFIEQFLAGIGRELRDVRSIVVTHAHPDHIGMAGALREASGAQIMMHSKEQHSMKAAAEVSLTDRVAELQEWGIASATIEKMRQHVADVEDGGGTFLEPDVLLEDGSIVPIDGLRWRVLHTPGHTPGHICLVDDEQRLLFSGDHLLPTVFPGLGLGAGFEANPIDHYLRSLRALEPFDDFEVIPGHGYRFHGLRARRLETAEHVLRRAREVAAVIHAEPQVSVWDLASRLTWKGGWGMLSLIHI